MVGSKRKLNKNITFRIHYIKKWFIRMSEYPSNTILLDGKVFPYIQKTNMLKYKHYLWMV